MKSSMCLAVVLFATSLAAIESPVDLQLPQSTILPGVPFDMTVIYRNKTDHPIGIGATATILVTPVGGETIKFPRIRVEALAPDQQPFNFELQSGETAIGTIGWHSNFFFEDAAVSGPGAYDIVLEVVGKSDEGVPYVGVVRTTPVRLTRIIPSGEDAEVWRRLQTAANGKWPSHGFGSTAAQPGVGAEIVAKYRNSNYYPYALLLGVPIRAVQPNVARDAVVRFHDSAAYSHLLIEAAAVFYAAGSRANERHASFAEIEDAFNEAAAYADSAAKSSNPAIKSHADILSRDARGAVERLRGGSAGDQ